MRSGGARSPGRVIVARRISGKPKPSKYNSNDVYGGSKLGNLWQVRELIARYPDLHANAVHPGVIFSGFGGMADKGGPGPWLESKLLISSEKGAKVALIAAIQDLPNGAYWHNVNGIMALPAGDAALDGQKSAAMWDQLETLSARYL